MNWTVYIVECVGSVAMFTCAIMLPLCREPVWWIHDYPADIQAAYFKTHERVPTKPLSAPVLAKKCAALALALVVFVALALLAGADSFRSAFFASFGIWLLVDWYDCFFLDWVLFANVKRVRLPGTEHMDRAYHQKKYHVARSAIGMALGLIPSLLCALVVALLK